MTSSDFFTFIGILLTIMSIYAAISREMFRLKFNCCIITIIVFTMMSVNYLIFFDCFFERGIYIPFLMNDDGIPANIWAYIISICFFALFFLYLGVWKYFPPSNNDKIIQHYKSLIYTNKTDLLVSYIERYHIEGIKKQISKINEETRIREAKNENEPIDDILSQKESETTATPKIEDSSNNVHTKQSLSICVLSDIIADSSFIGNVVKVSPLFLLEVFTKIESKGFDSDKSFEKKQVNFTNSIAIYFRELINSHNKDFIGELKQIWTNNSAIDPNVKEQIKDTKFLKYFFSEVESQTFVSRFDIENVFYEESEKEIKSQNFWSENPDENFYSKYYESASFQYLMFENILMRYNKSNETSALMLDLCKMIANRFWEKRKHTFAYKYLEDILEMISFCNQLSEKTVAKTSSEKIKHYLSYFK